MIVCRRTSKIGAEHLVERIRKYVSDTKYSCSVGYSYADEGKPIDDLFKEADEHMYDEKAEYYKVKNKQSD